MAVARALQAAMPNPLPGLLTQIAGNVLEANRWWQRGAKAGDVESMFKAGFAMYERCEGWCLGWALSQHHTSIRCTSWQK